MDYDFQNIEKKEEKLKSKTDRKQFGDAPDAEGGEADSDAPAADATNSEST